MPLFNSMEEELRKKLGQVTPPTSESDIVTDQLLREAEDRLANPGKKIVYKDAVIDDIPDTEIETIFPEPIKLPEAAGVTPPPSEIRQERIFEPAPTTASIPDTDLYKSQSRYQIPSVDFDKLIASADKMDDNQGLWTSIARAWANAGEGMTGVTSDKGLWDNLEKQARRHGQRARSRFAEQKAKLDLGRDLAKEDPNSPEALAVKKMLADEGYGGVIRPEMNIRQLEGAFGKYWDTVYQSALRKYVANTDREARITEKGLDRDFQRSLQAGKDAMTINENEKDRLAREELERLKIQNEKLKSQLPSGELDFINNIPSQYRQEALKEYAKVRENDKEVGNIIETAKDIYKMGPLESMIPSWVPGAGGQKESYDAALAKLGSAVMKIVPGLRSDQDAIRYVRPMLPKPTETEEQAEIKMKRFEEWLYSFRPETPLLKSIGKELPVPKTGDRKSRSDKINNINNMTEEEMDAEIERLESKKKGVKQ